MGFVLRREGGFVDRADDRGGPTNFGITQRFYDEDRAERGLPPESVRLLSRAAAIDVYRRKFWIGANCPSLPVALQLLHFDTAVHFGRTGAARMLQWALEVPDDGRIGPITLAAAQRADATALAGTYATRRIALYLKSSDAQFRRGWLRRAGEALAATL